jgi:hypothetical protein
MPAPHQRVDDVENLRQLNLDLTEWERNRGVVREVATAVIDERFCFRRGDGSITDRDGFLKGLADPDNRTDELVAHVVRIDVMDLQAFVEVHVFLDGTRGGKDVRGWFRNLRLWEKQKDGKWHCVLWFNKGLPEK